ncbi:MAG: CDP-alcohol phosphatidyltransferase family protein [Dehalococcoidia bacterium]
MARLTSMRLLPSRAPAGVLAPIVAALAGAGVTPNMLSVAGLLGNGAAGVLVARGDLVAAGIVMLLASGLDMLDGALARATGKAGPVGALIDSTFDRVSEAAVLFGVLWYALDRGHDDQAALAFVAVVGSMLVSYVRARVEGLGERLTDGLFTRAERVVLLALALLFGFLRGALWVLAVLTVVTAAQRLYLGARVLGDSTSGKGPR